MTLKEIEIAEYAKNTVKTYEQMTWEQKSAYAKVYWEEMTKDQQKIHTQECQRLSAFHKQEARKQEIQKLCKVLKDSGRTKPYEEMSWIEKDTYAKTRWEQMTKEQQKVHTQESQKRAIIRKQNLVKMTPAQKQAYMEECQKGGELQKQAKEWIFADEKEKTTEQYRQVEDRILANIVIAEERAVALQEKRERTWREKREAEAEFKDACATIASYKAHTSQTKEKRASVVKRGIFGAILAGPVGGMIGALSAIDKNNKG